MSCMNAEKQRFVKLNHERSALQRGTNARKIVEIFKHLINIHKQHSQVNFIYISTYFKLK